MSLVFIGFGLVAAKNRVGNENREIKRGNIKFVKFGRPVSKVTGVDAKNETQKVRFAGELTELFRNFSREPPQLEELCQMATIMI
ncbi:hypothetical protein IKE88_02765 [Candidatus Saccharibacteria bacterium]|nr:hypothetical protein [Candidatus Saccharibacteria bacterium]